MVKHRFSAPYDIGSKPIGCYIILILYYCYFLKIKKIFNFFLSRKGIEPLYRPLQGHTLPLSYLDLIYYYNNYILKWRLWNSNPYN